MISHMSRQLRISSCAVNSDGRCAPILRQLIIEGNAKYYPSSAGKSDILKGPPRPWEGAAAPTNPMREESTVVSSAYRLSTPVHKAIGTSYPHGTT